MKTNKQLWGELQQQRAMYEARYQENLEQEVEDLKRMVSMLEGWATTASKL